MPGLFRRPPPYPHPQTTRRFPPAAAAVPSSLVFLCGAECGIATEGNSVGGTATTRHWTSSGGTPAIDTTVFRSGAKAYRFDAAATLPRLRKDFVASNTIAYVRMYLRITAAPSTAIQCATGFITVGNNFTLVISTGAVLQAGFISALTSGPTLSVDTWYGVECEVDITANPNRVRWRTWDAGGGWVSQTDNTRAQAADTFTTSGIQVGMTTGPTSGMSLYLDDILLGGGTAVAADYDPAVSKGGRVLRYTASVDGTHAFTDNDFEYDDTTGILASATDVWQRLDDADQTSATDFISQNVAGAGKYIRIGFANEASQTAPRAVATTSRHRSSATAANEHHLRASDDGATWTNLLGDWAAAGNDIGSTSALYRHVVMATPPAGGSWTQAKVNSTEIEWGNSDDVTPFPYIDNISLEVEWDESGAGGTLVERTATDSLTFSDVADRVLILARSVSDSLTFSDTAARVGTFLRSVSDSLTFSDTATRVLTLARAGADSLTHSDAATRTLTLARAAADSLTHSDVATRVATLLRAASDSLTFSDAAVATKLIIRTAVDSLTFSDTATRLGTFLRAASDSLTFSDVSTRVLTLLRTASDSLTHSDVVTRTLTLFRTAADSLTFSDVAEAIKLIVRSAVDSLTFSDAATRTLTAARSASDSLTFSDTAARVLTAVRSAADSLVHSDAATRAVTAFRSASDALNFSDAAAAIVGQLASGGVPPVISGAVHAVPRALAKAVVPTAIGIRVTPD